MENHLKFYKGEKDTLMREGFAYSFAKELKNYSGWKKNYKCARGGQCCARIWTTGEWQEDEHGRQYQRGIAISSKHNHDPEESDENGAAQTGNENATSSKIEQEREQGKSSNCVENGTQTIEIQREEEPPKKICRQDLGRNVRFYKGEKDTLNRKGFAYTYAQELKNYSGWKKAYKCARGCQCRARIWTTGDWEEDSQKALFQRGIVIATEHNHEREGENISNGNLSDDNVNRSPSIISLEDSSEEDETHQSKSLKDLAKHAKQLAAKRRTKKRKLNTESSESGTGDESDDEEGRASFDSEDDSDGRRYKKYNSCKNRKEMERQCLEFLNTATMEEIRHTKKFNDRFMDLIEKKRPFDDYKSMCSFIGTKFTSQIDQYLEYLEKRGILDQILDNCTLHVEKIQEELQNLQQNANQNICSQPRLLNSSCVLHPYQQVGLQWLITMHKLGFNSILADEMGLGKTIQIIAFLAWAKEQSRMKGPHLIVVPSSTLENWMNELQKWCPAMKVLTYYGSREERGQLRYLKSNNNVDIILTTYNMATSQKEDRGFFKLFSLNYIIYDEGHMLRSCGTNRYKNLMKIQGQRKILLTGTPLQNNLVELISLLYFTCTKLFSRYCHDTSTLTQMFAHKRQMLDRKSTENNRKRSNAKNKCYDKNDTSLDQSATDAEMQDLEGPLYERHKIAQAKKILQPFVLRRLKTQVLTALPKKFEELKMCSLTETQDELYNDVMHELRMQKESAGNTNYMGLLMQMRQVANHPLLYRKNYDDSKLMKMAKILCSKERPYKGKNPELVAEDLSYETDITIHGLCNKFECIASYKLDTDLSLDSGKCKQLDQMIPPILARGEKLLIFSQFTTMLDILELYLEYRNHSFFRLDGSTPVMERQELINQFNTDESVPVFLLSTKAGGLGINLTAANHIIIHDIDINPYNDKQAEDRCHRMGQMREVFVTGLVSNGTVEESMLALAQKKLELEKCVTAASSHNSPDKDQFLCSEVVEEMLSQAITLSRAETSTIKN